MARPKMPTIWDEHSGTRKSIFTDSWLKRLKTPRKTDQPNQWVYIETMQRGCGLMLVCSYGGAKTWRGLRYDRGRPDTERLGQYLPDTDRHMSLKEARGKAEEFWRDHKKFRAQAAPDSFQEVAEDWLARKVTGKLRSAKDIRWQLDKYVHPKWRHLRFLDITRSDVVALLDDIEAAVGAPTCDKVLATLSSMMGWYATRHDHYLVPLVRGMRRHGLVQRERILTDDEITALWAAEGMFADTCRFLLLTGQRKGKIADLLWSDIDAAGTWKLRSAPREKGNIGRVVLPPMALDIVRRQPMISGEPRIFPLADWSGAKAALDKQLRFDASWVIHDLRRTCRSLLARRQVGVLRDIAEAVLGHELRGVEGTYDRYDRFQEKSDALVRLAAEIERIVHPQPTDKVVQFAPSR